MIIQTILISILTGIILGFLARKNKGFLYVVIAYVLGALQAIIIHLLKYDIN